MAPVQFKLDPKSVFSAIPANTITTDPQLLDSRTPPDVIVTTSARAPIDDPTLGIGVSPPDGSGAAHRLVTLGDSLTHGFQSLAIYNTDFSFPAIIAYEMGWLNHFWRPHYPGFGGLPLNIEYLLRDMEQKIGKTLGWWNLPLAAFAVHHHLQEVEDWWERGPGSKLDELTNLNHDLAVYGWDLRDTLSRTANVCKAEIGQPRDSLVLPLVSDANQRAALRVLNYSQNADPGRNDLSPLGQAARLGNDGGIETLTVLLGANNVLGSVVQLRVTWSDDSGYKDLKLKSAYTVWRPVHFASELLEVAAQVQQIGAKHVIWGTVPHVTIAPIARGVATKVRPGSRYFPFYTRPWITDGDFDSKASPHLTEVEARALDSAVDQYNYCIADIVRQARAGGLDWYLFDLAGMLDRLASRRYIQDFSARPTWWSDYQLPPQLAALKPKPDSKFLAADDQGARSQGGLFSLDGVHPTTVAYGLVAQELIHVMQRAGVTFFSPDGTSARSGAVTVDFDRLLQLDTLISSPPSSITSDLEVIGWVEQQIDLFRRMFII